MLVQPLNGDGANPTSTSEDVELLIFKKGKLCRMKLGVSLGSEKEKRKCFLACEHFFHFVLFGFYTFNSAGTSRLQSSPLRLRETPGAVLTYSPLMRSSCGFTTSLVQYIQESCACLNSSGFLSLQKTKSGFSFQYF